MTAPPLSSEGRDEQEPGHGVGLAWFFAYGSLMWRPGFEHDVVEKAVLDGWHRALCVYSWVWRGTPECPGLVMGLTSGRSCLGKAIAVPVAREAEVLAYLDARELVTNVYYRECLPLRLEHGEEIRAWCYLARPEHEQFAGQLPLRETARLVRQGRGRGGDNIDYVRSTVAHLREMGIHDDELEALMAELDATD